MTSSLSEILIRVIEKSVKERVNPWIHSSHELITELEIDQRGEAGENFMTTCLRQNGHKVEIDRTTDPQEKSWDIRVDNKIMIEIKTATQGKKTKTFQHERIMVERPWHALALLDIAPEDIYLTLAPKNTIPVRKKNNIWTVNEKKVHMRRSGEIKWDFSLKDVRLRKVSSIADIEKQYQELLKTLQTQDQTSRQSEMGLK